MDLKKEKILSLYYKEHLKQIDIAKKLGITKQYVSKVINQDNRNICEKEKRKKYLKRYFLSYNRPKKEDNSYEQLLSLQRQNSMEMSYSNKGKISDYDYLKWNRSAYKQNKNGVMVLDKSLTVGYTTPKHISMKAKVPTQKYKHQNCFNR